MLLAASAFLPRGFLGLMILPPFGWHTAQCLLNSSFLCLRQPFSGTALPAVAKATMENVTTAAEISLFIILPPVLFSSLFQNLIHPLRGKPAVQGITDHHGRPLPQFPRQAHGIRVYIPSSVVPPGSTPRRIRRCDRISSHPTLQQEMESQT